MNIKKFNDELRELLSSLVSDGFIQKDISSLTFGSNRQDQLKSFLEGRDISGKPLSRIFDGLDFELHLVPISKKDIAEQEEISTLTENAFETIRFVIVNYLESIKSKKNKRKNIILYVDTIIDKINKGEF